MPESSYFFNGIVLPTGGAFREVPAFHFALKLALAAQCHLRMIQIDPSSDEKATSVFPSVRDTLTFWKNMDHVATEADLKEAGIGVRKIRAHKADPFDAIVEKTKDTPDALLVLSPRKRNGISALFQRSISLALMRETRLTCFMVPDGCRPLVDPKGFVTITRIIIPVEEPSSALRMLRFAQDLVALFQVNDPNIIFVQVGQAAEHQLSLPPDFTWNWELRKVTGEPAGAIITLAADEQASLVVMETSGRDGLLETFTGSTTERVIKNASCPVLVCHKPA